MLSRAPRRTEPLLCTTAHAPAARGTAHQLLRVLLCAVWVLSKGISPFCPPEKMFKESNPELALGLLVRGPWKTPFALNHPPCVCSALTPGLFNTLQLLIKFLSRRISSRMTDCYYSPSELLIPASKFCESFKSSCGCSGWGEKTAAYTAGIQGTSAPLPAVVIME